LTFVRLSWSRITNKLAINWQTFAQVCIYLEQPLTGSTTLASVDV